VAAHTDDGELGISREQKKLEFCIQTNKKLKKKAENKRCCKEGCRMRLPSPPWVDPELGALHSKNRPLHGQIRRQVVWSGPPGRWCEVGWICRRTGRGPDGGVGAARGAGSNLEQCGCGEESNTEGQRPEEVRFRVDGIEAASVPLCHGGAAVI
jgi:hypothetical protein